MDLVAPVVYESTFRMNFESCVKRGLIYFSRSNRESYRNHIFKVDRTANAGGASLQGMDAGSRR
jgi:hypothetical protein